MKSLTILLIFLLSLSAIATAMPTNHVIRDLEEEDKNYASNPMPTYDVLPHRKDWYKIKVKIQVGRRTLIDEGKCSLCSSRFSRSTKQYVTAFKSDNYLVFASSISDKSDRLKYMMVLNDKVYFSAVKYFPENINDARVFTIEEGFFLII